MESHQIRHPETDTITKFIIAYHISSTFASDDVLRRCNELVASMVNTGRIQNEFQLKEAVEAVKDRIINIYQAVRLDINPKAKYLKIGTLWPVYDQRKQNEGSDKQLSKSV